MRRIAFPLLALTIIGGPALAGQVLHRPSDSEPDTIDPQKTTSDNSIGIDRDLFTGLVTLSPDLQPIPGIAERWETSTDGKLWTFHLRPDAKWSNGDPLTADDFVYAFRRLVDPKTAASDTEQLAQVVNANAIIAGKEHDLTRLGAVATDPHTLTVTLSEPRPLFVFLMTDPQTFPLHRATLEKWGNDWTQPGHIVSDGPYRLKAWTPQSEMVLERNPNFYDAGTVKIDEVHWVDTEDLAAGLRRFRGGELDWVRLSRDSIKWARYNAADQLKVVPADGNYFLYMNMAKGPLSKDIRVREAINLAIDRDVIVKHIDDRGQLPAYGVVAPVVPRYTQQTMYFKNMPLADRVAKAKALMVDAGYTPDAPMKITVSYTTSENGKAVLAAIRQMLLPIGIDLVLDNMEWQVFVNRTNQRDFEMGFMGTEGSYIEAEPALQNYWSGAGIFNFTGYASPKFDALYQAGMTEMDPIKRRADLEGAEATALADYPVAPLEFDVNAFLVNPKLDGFLGNVRFPQTRYLSFKDSAS